MVHINSFIRRNMSSGSLIYIYKVNYLNIYTLLFKMNHQDLDDVIIYGKQKQIAKKEIRKKKDPEAQRLYKLENEEFSTSKIKTTTPEQRKAMIQGRITKKLTQKDLATQLAINIKNIQGYENGKINVNNQEIVKIERFLGIKLTGKLNA